MTYKLIFTLSVFIIAGLSALAQKPKTSAKQKSNTGTKTSELSNAEKMPYARANKYYGPGTFYLYAPGKPNNKTANNIEANMRDLTGISADDLYTELAKQGFVRVPKNEVKRWFNENNGKDKEFFYAPDKSYVLQTAIKSLDRSPATPNGYRFKVSDGVMRYVLIPKADSLKVMEAMWQFLRNLHELKANLVSIESKFKKSREGVFPFERVATTGWSNFRAGSWVQVPEKGKLVNKFERHENILRRTIGKPDFDIWILGMETDFYYGMRVTLKNEGYILFYNLIARTLADLEPGNTWVKYYPELVRENKIYIQNDKRDIEQYRGKLPPNIEDLELLLHLK